MNKAFLVGNLGTAPKLQTIASGQSLCKFSIATHSRSKDANGERIDRTEWHNIVAWGKTADIASQYLKKGSRVLIEGRIQTDTYETKDGTKRFRAEIIAEQIKFLDAKNAAKTADK